MFNMDEVKSIVDDVVAAKGYAYLLISEGKGTLATVVFRDFKNVEIYLERSVNKFREILNIDIRNKKMFTGYRYWAFPVSAIYWQP